MSNETSDEVIEVTEQETISFYDHPIVTVQLADGRIGVVLRWLCEGLGIDIQAQVRRVQRTLPLRGQLVTARVKTDGGPQAMPTLVLKAVAYWLSTIDAKRVEAGEKRDTIVLYQQECMDVLYQHFAEKAARSRAVVPAEMAPKPADVPADAPTEQQIAYHEAMIRYHEDQREALIWRQQADARLDDHEARLGQVEGFIEQVQARFQQDPLSPEHQSTVQACVKRLAELTGRHPAAIYEDLRMTFHVGKYTQIPEARWSDVFVWLRDRIQRAGGDTGTLDNEQGSLF
jgi:hypothetical protein